MSDCRKCAEFDWCVENEDCGLFKLKPMTNADRIRAMADEELAQVVRNPCDILDHYPAGWCKERNCGYQCALEWLKQEVADDL